MLNPSRIPDPRNVVVTTGGVSIMLDGLLSWSVALLSAALLVMSGCSSSSDSARDAGSNDSAVTIQDWRSGDGRCELHGRSMDSIVVNGPNGPAPVMEPDYFEAKENRFPHCGIEYFFFNKERGYIYVCPVCEQNREAWRKQQQR